MLQAFQHIPALLAQTTTPPAAAADEPASAAATLLDQLAALPTGVHGLIFLVMVAGLALWVVGSRFIMPLTLIFCSILGMHAAFFISRSINIQGTSVTIALGIGLLLGLITGMLLYRSAMAAACGVVFAAAAPIVALTVMGPPPANHTNDTGPIPPHELFLDGIPIAPPSPDPTATDTTNKSDDDVRVADATDKVAAFLSELWHLTKQTWANLPRSYQSTLALTTLLGAALGSLAGLWLPNRAASIVTALFGAAVWIPAALWLCSAARFVFTDRLVTMSARQWLITWAAIGILGMIIQWRLASRSAASATPAEAS